MPLVQTFRQLESALLTRYSSIVTGTEAIDSTYDLTTAHSHLVQYDVSSDRTNAFLDSISIRLEDIVSATSVTMRLTWDAAGDYIVCPDTVAEISTGLTTTDTGYAVYAFELPIYGVTSTDETLYVFVKTNTGTANMTQTQLMYRK